MNYKKQLQSPSFGHSNRSLKNWLAYKGRDKFLLKYAGLYKGKMYDLGCGEAPFKEFFLQFAEEYVGIDWSEHNHASHEHVVADLNKKIPVASQTADCIICVSVLEHLYDPQLMLHEAYRLLRPDGNLVLQVPWQWWIHEAPIDYFRYTPYCLEMMLEKAGFKEIKIEPESGFFTMWVLKFNYFSARFIRGPKPIRWLIKIGLVPFWSIGQICAPLLDKLDQDRMAETTGYFVTAKKL